MHVKSSGITPGLGGGCWAQLELADALLVLVIVSSFPLCDFIVNNIHEKIT